MQPPEEVVYKLTETDGMDVGVEAPGLCSCGHL
jgi:hypothetical protein